MRSRCAARPSDGALAELLGLYFLGGSPSFWVWSEFFRRLGSLFGGFNGTGLQAFRRTGSYKHSFALLGTLVIRDRFDQLNGFCPVPAETSQAWPMGCCVSFKAHGLSNV